MQIRHVLIKVDDQEKALAFYTSKLGFVKHLDIPMGKMRWLTVTSPDGAEGEKTERNASPCATPI